MSTATEALRGIEYRLYDLQALLEAVRSHVECQYERNLIQADASNELTRLASLAATQAGRLAEEVESAAAAVEAAPVAVAHGVSHA